MFVWTVVNDTLKIEMITGDIKKAEEFKNLMNRNTDTKWYIRLKRI